MPIVLIALSHTSQAQIAEKQQPSVAGIRYVVEFSGASDGLHEYLRSVSDSVRLESFPPRTINMLRKRANEDQRIFLDALHARGYFDAAVRFDIQETHAPVKLVYTIQAGAQYTLAEVQVKWIDGSGTALPDSPSPDHLGLTQGSPALSKPIIAAETRISRYLRQRGYPLSTVSRREAWINRDMREMNVTFFVDPGPRARFGRTKVEGLESVDQGFIGDLLTWERGDLFDSRKLDELRLRYFGLGVFSVADIDPAAELTQDGELDINVNFVERLHRTVSASIGFETERGPAISLGWEHRNLTGRADPFRIEAGGNAQDYGVSLDYARPRFRGRDQRLYSSLDLRHEDYEGYESQFIAAESGVERKFDERVTASLGIRTKWSSVKDAIDTDTSSYFLIGTPFQLTCDRRNDEADPSNGYLGKINLTPFLGFGDVSPVFVKSSLEYRRYWNVGERTTLAGRISVGNLLLAELSDVPADERYYVGGANSVRGYGYRDLAPINADGELTGGRSFFEVSVEARRRVNKAIGLVLFLDGGNAYEGIYPDFDQPLRWGAGVGIRVFTPAGPIRVDAAIPLSRRNQIDDAFHIYASFGHTF